MELEVLTADVLHPDGRHMTFHVIDALHRAAPRDMKKNETSAYSTIMEHCCGLIGKFDVKFTMQDCFQINLMDLFSVQDSGQGLQGFPSNSSHYV